MVSKENMLKSGYSYFRMPRLFGREASISGKLVFALLIAGIISGFATFAAFTNIPPFGDDPHAVIWLLNINLVILLLMITVIARRVVGLLTGRRKGIAGSRLHVRMVFIFSLLTALPAIFMTVFAAFFLNFAVESWFNEKVSTAVNNAQAVAEAYLEEHQQVIRADALAMANDLDRQADIILLNQESLEKFIRTQAFFRNFTEAMIVDSDGRAVAQTGLSFSLGFESIPSYELARAQDGEVVVMTGGNDDRVRALLRLRHFNDSYLFVGRIVDPTVLGHLSETRDAVSAYNSLETQRSDLQLTFTMIFVVVALLLLLTAIWFGLMFSRQMIMPISALTTATERVRAGDLSVRVEEFKRKDEFDVLASAFNRMTSQIQEQRDELVLANRQLDQRRRFTETVLAGVSSGILGVNEDGKITIANNAACDLFGVDSRAMIGRKASDFIPGLGELLVKAHKKKNKITQAELPVTLPDKTKRILLVRIAVETISETDKGAVLTFDDITELQAAQRKAAWADVARRIAHEIKNPLTPIQLSAERLKRKYLDQISEDPETFSKCTDTIIHHVGDIGRMVNEFSSFARMPEPVMRKENITPQIKDMLVLHQQAHPEIIFHMHGMNGGREPLFANVDAQQLRQALTNIVQNAVDSVSERINREKDDGGKAEPGRIYIVLAQKPDGNIVINVTDNGLGLPKDEDPQSLTEPYVTHRAKGTGLGLAIVKKIMEDHKGSINIGETEWLKDIEGWSDLGGATISLILPEYRTMRDVEGDIEQDVA